MKKRGELLTLWMLVSIIGALLIAYALANIGSQRASGEAFFKSRVAKELALDINALYSVPGDSYIIENNDYNLSFEFKDNKVSVLSGNFGLFSGSSYDFVRSGQEDIDYKLENPDQIVISKVNNKIMVTENIPDFFKGITTKDLYFKNRKILFYYELNDAQSRNLAENIVILNNNKKDFPNLYSSHDIDDIKNSEIIIGIYSKDIGEVSFYVNKKLLKSKESLSLANAFKINVDKVVVSNDPVSLEIIDEDKKHILENDKIAVYVVFPQTKKISDIANAIYKSLDLYSE